MRALVRPRKQLQPAAVPEHSSCSNTWLDADVNFLMLVISPHSHSSGTLLPVSSLLFLAREGGGCIARLSFSFTGMGGRTFTAVQQQIQNLEVIANSPSSTDSCPPEFLTLTTEIPSSHQICTPVTSKSPRPCTNWI